MENIKPILSPEGDTPHGYCYLSVWKLIPAARRLRRSRLLLTYLSLSLTFVYFVQGRHLLFKSMFICFGIWIVASGLKSALSKRNDTFENRGELQPCAGFFHFE
jgi:hypothetical protein